MAVDRSQQGTKLNATWPRQQMNEFCSSDCELKGILAKCHAVSAQDPGALMGVSWVHSSPLADIGSSTELLQDP